MLNDELSISIQTHLHELTTRYPDRAPGTPGNIHATRYFSRVASGLGFSVRNLPLSVIDTQFSEAYIRIGEVQYSLHTGLYSLGVDHSATIVAASTRDELQNCNAQGNILLMHGSLTTEPLMPRNYPFYNPDEHQTLYAQIEQKQPAAIIAITGKHPGLHAAKSPFPLFEDGDFDIPNLYTDGTTGTSLLQHTGEKAVIFSDAKRVPAISEQPIIRIGSGTHADIILSAHIDCVKNSPGAIDNAGSVAVLLGTLELLSEKSLSRTIDVVPFNGEDSWAAYGELAYLEEIGSNLPELCINSDGVGVDRSAWSVYNLQAEHRSILEEVFADKHQFIEGIPWYQGDHAVFAMQGIPSIAFTTERMEELWQTIAHTSFDTMERISFKRLTTLAQQLSEFLVRL
jgi:aminopeptidase YwaD